MKCLTKTGPGSIIRSFIKYRIDFIFEVFMKVNSDFLVIGSGIAGLSFALKAAKHGRVAMVTKREISESATNYAQGGIASVFSQEDTFDAHVEATLVAGA